VLAERMQLQHHSAVELVDRLSDRGFLLRFARHRRSTPGLGQADSRRRGVSQKLSLHHLQELQSSGPKFVKILQGLIESIEAPPSTAVDLTTDGIKNAE
jgi:hypothetical protein